MTSETRQAKEIRKRMAEGWSAEQIGALMWKCYRRAYEVRDGDLRINISGAVETFSFAQQRRDLVNAVRSCGI